MIGSVARGGIHLDADFKEVDRMARDLRLYGEKVFPIAVRNSLNTSAFEGRKQWIGEMRTTFVLRNTFTTRSLRVEKAIGNNVPRMASYVGSVLPYMKLQEFGGIERGSGKKHALPTAMAAGQAMRSRPRRKAVRRANYLGAIQIKHAPSGKSRKQRNAIALNEAIAKGRRFVFLDLEDRQGIFKVTGNKKRRRVRMIWDLSRPLNRVPRHPTLQPALVRLGPRLLAIHRNSIIDTMTRYHVLGYGTPTRRSL